MEPRSGAAGRAPAGQRGQVADPGVPRNSDPRRSEAHDGTALPRRLGRAMLVGSVLLSAVSIATIMLLLPGGTPVSSDPGAPSLPNWVILLPPAGGILLTLVLPWRAGPMPVVPVRLSRLLLTTTGLLVLLAVFSLVTGLVPLRGEDYVLGKFVLLMLIPGVLLLLVRDAVKIATRSGWWRWWAPLLVIAAWFYLSQVAPWNPRCVTLQPLDEPATGSDGERKCCDPHQDPHHPRHPSQPTGRGLLRWFRRLGSSRDRGHRCPSSLSPGRLVSAGGRGGRPSRARAPSPSARPTGSSSPRSARTSSPHPPRRRPTTPRWRPR